jgi:hypothetical protein
VSENNQLQELSALRADYNKLCDELRYQELADRRGER